MNRKNGKNKLNLHSSLGRTPTEKYTILPPLKKIVSTQELYESSKVDKTTKGLFGKNEIDGNRSKIKKIIASGRKAKSGSLGKIP